MTSPFPQPGEVVDGKYRIDSQIASGGYSRVFRATELAKSRPIALKLLVPPVVDETAEAQRAKLVAIERFRREAEMLRQLRSPFTIRLFGFGQCESGHLYMALEYVDGFNLHEALTHFGPFSAERALRILSQLLHSLEEAHQAGVLHRDLKPANVLVYSQGQLRDCVKLLDFGIARSSQQTSKSFDLTQSGMMVGTPRYMAPEQMRSVNADLTPSSDLYSLGLIIYEILVGVPAIQRDPAFDVIRLQMAPENFHLPPELQIPDVLRMVVDRLLEKDQTKRFQSARHVLDVLGDPPVPTLDEESVPYVEIPQPLAPPIELIAPQPAPSRVAGEKLHPWTLPIVGFALIVAVGLLLLMVTAKPVQSESAPVAAPSKP